MKDQISLLKKRPLMPLYDVVYHYLKQDILKGVYKPGDRITEEDISAKAGISRTPVREAIKRLAAEGLVEFLPKRGAIVLNNSAEEVSFLWDNRIYLETKLSELAAKKADDEQKAELREYIRMMKESEGTTDSDEMEEILFSMNEYILQIVKLNQAERLYNLVNTFSSEVTDIAMKDHARLSDAFKEHIEIATAICENDAEKAASLTHDHLLKWKVIYMKQYFPEYTEE